MSEDISYGAFVLERCDITYMSELTPTPIGGKTKCIIPIGVGV